MQTLNVAVIDDATMIRDLVKKFIRQNFPQAKIFDASNGQQGKTLLKTHPINLILCDWEMPGMNGEELLVWTRQQDNFKNTPFIMVTSRGDKEFVVKAIESGVSDYLVKPFNNKQFLEKIHKALKRHGMKVPESATVAKPMTGRGGDSLAVLTAGSSKPSSPAPAKKKPSGPLPKGVASLRTSEGEVKCALKKLDLTSMLGVFKYSDYMPELLSQVSMDLEFTRGEEKKVLRMNGFIQSMSATNNQADCEFIQTKVIFMDEDAEKRALISEYVGQFN
ncbi:response regulator [Pleionea sp. CnH1-48]|uniref:response regulator n=1 Tax=Pleionea sp. CnH1-48 TaxID=2954494 RepID=UPI002097892F|nr:response regulator [Pleionea sp. CnH1-48]MCO7225517.1 response regulator [Pleionea sp. CnH1-48]